MNFKITSVEEYNKKYKRVFQILIFLDKKYPENILHFKANKIIYDTPIYNEMVHNILFKSYMYHKQNIPDIDPSQILISEGLYNLYLCSKYNLPNV